jgi:hypothetical protein
MVTIIPYGYCHCGCGSKTNVPKKTSSACGQFKGVPLRYVHGHHRRITGQLWEARDCGYKTQCWIWLYSLTTDGYAETSKDHQTLLVHRVNYINKYGPVPVGFDLDHLCRVRRCVNPDHLEPVLPRVNIRRAISTKLHTGLVAQIRLLATKGLKHREIAELFPIVSRRHISNVIARRRWAND